MINVRAIALIVAALGAAGGTAYVVKGVLAGPKPVAAVPTNQPAPAPVARILVASKDLPIGTLLKAGDLGWQPWPEDGVVDGYVLETPDGMKDFEGAVVRSRLYRGEPISTSRVIHPGDRGFLAAVLEPGKRAVAVPVDATTVVGGFILPGDRVDVILTFKQSQSSGEGGEQDTRHFSETLLSGIRVLALDQAADSPDGQAKLAKTVTLEVTPKQAEMVMLGLDLGELSLSLRSLNQSGTTLAQLKTLAAAELSDGKGGRRSYTRDVDILDMVGDPMGLQPPAGMRRSLNVLRGSEAKEIRY